MSMYYKTRLCPNNNRGACSKGSKCTFAHGVEELRGPPGIAVDSGYRNEQQRHSDSVLVVDSNWDNSWNTHMCHMWQKTRNCQFGEKCRYAHGYQELRKGENQMVNNIAAASKSPVGHPTSNNIVAASKSPIDHPTSNASASKNRNVKKKGGYLSMDCPHKISQIYGDWIDDEPPASHVAKQANKEHNSSNHITNEVET